MLNKPYSFSCFLLFTFHGYLQTGGNSYRKKREKKLKFILHRFVHRPEWVKKKNTDEYCLKSFYSKLEGSGNINFQRTSWSYNMSWYPLLWMKNYVRFSFFEVVLVRYIYMFSKHILCFLLMSRFDSSAESEDARIFFHFSCFSNTLTDGKGTG